MHYFLHNSDISIDLKDNKVEIHDTSAESFKVTLVETGLNTKTAGRLKQVQKYLTDLLREHLKALLPDGQHFPVPNEVIVVYLSSAMLGMITWWLDNDLPYTAEQMNRMFYQLAAQPLLDKIAISKDAVALKLISET